MSLLSAYTDPVLIVSPLAFWQGIQNEVFTEIMDEYYFQGFKIAISRHLERDIHVATLREMPCYSTPQ